VLELGCGTGRITRVLLDLGLEVTAVDNSADMLSAVPGPAATVRADIEALRLAERFDTVLLASCLINHPSAETRRGLLQTARFHMKPDGQLLMEHHDPEWLSNVQPGPVGRNTAVALSVVTVTRFGDATEMTLRYDLGGESWLHSFNVVVLNEPAIQRLLAENGLCPAARPDPSGRWVRAVMSSPGA
jgi:SAM-dependent methyltransferase